jgi:hypothetical protein
VAPADDDDIVTDDFVSLPDRRCRTQTLRGRAEASSVYGAHVAALIAAGLYGLAALATAWAIR